MTWSAVMAIANAVVTLSYLAISFAIARGLWRSRQWRRNPLGLATAAIFFTCAIGHGLHAADMPSHVDVDDRGASGPVDPATPDHQHGSAGSSSGGIGSDGALYRAIWDSVTAAVGVYYWNLRGRFPALVRGAAVFEDVLLRQAAENTLRESEERFRGIVETTIEGVVLVDPYGCITYVNAQFAAMVGRSEQELLGTPLAVLGTADDDRERIRQGLSQAREGGARRFEVMLSRSASDSGSVGPGAVGPGAVGPGPASLASVCAQVALSPRVDAELGDVDGALAMVADVTEQKNIEQQLRQAQRLDAVGQLAGGVAHDFNNLLTVIDGYAAMLLADGGLDTAKRHDLTSIREAASRANALTRQLLAFSRTQAARPQAVDVNDLVLGIDEMLHRVIREDVDLVVAATADPAIVWADRGQLEQVLVNLTVNSRDAMPHGGRLTIRTEHLVLDAEAAARVGVAAGGHVVLSVADTGCGMSEEVKTRVFEPFFTTKEPGKGTGLGLSTAYGIVRHAGGVLAVETEPGVGSTFRIYLPDTTRATAERRPHPEPGAVASGTETILLVEDDAAVRQLTERILLTAGYRVVTATDSQHALALAAADPSVDLLVTDVVMPGIDGRQLADQVRAMMPGLPVLFMSAYTRGALTTMGSEPGVAYIEKPFTAPALTERIRGTLADLPERRPEQRSGRPSDPSAKAAV